jgi:hypothetical protein
MKLKIKKILKVNKMTESTDITVNTPRTGMASMIGKRMTKVVPFMDMKVTMSKLSVAEVMQIQKSASTEGKDPEEANENEGFDVLRTIIRTSVAESEGLSDEDFNEFPLDELSKLSASIMKFSGIDSGK